jgi:hypothetical protein
MPTAIGRFLQTPNEIDGHPVLEGSPTVNPDISLVWCNCLSQVLSVQIFFKISFEDVDHVSSARPLVRYNSLTFTQPLLFNQNRSHPRSLLLSSSLPRGPLLGLTSFSCQRLWSILQSVRYSQLSSGVFASRRLAVGSISKRRSNLYRTLCYGTV